MKYISFTFLCAILLLYHGSHTQAQIPALVPVSGNLSDSDGVPLTEPVDVVFSIYRRAEGGNALYAEKHTVEPDNGFFTVYLGSGTPVNDLPELSLALFRDNENLYLGFTIGDNEEATPRLLFGTAPKAAVAQYCMDAETVGGVAVQDLALQNESLGALSCAEPGYVAQWNGSDWTCGKIAGDSTYSDGDAINAVVNSTTVQDVVTDWCYDTEAELTAILDDNYALASHSHDEYALTSHHR